MEKKIAILIIMWLVLFKFNPSGTIVRPVVNVGEFISDFESMGYSGLFHMMPTAAADDVVKPDEVVKCTCGGSGKVSYDGGTSYTSCPCLLNGGKCVCDSQKQVAESPVLFALTDEMYVTYLLKNYFVAKATSAFCLPCKQWDTKYLDEFEKAGMTVKEYSLEDKNYEKFFESAGVDVIPKFFICTMADNLFHLKSDKINTYSVTGSEFNTEQAIQLMAALDKSLHPHLKEGVFYIRKSQKSHKLGDKEWASIEAYKAYIAQKVDWDLSKLSSYELKAIYDDIQNDALGEINGF